MFLFSFFTSKLIQSVQKYLVTQKELLFFQILISEQNNFCMNLTYPTIRRRQSHPHVGHVHVVGSTPKLLVQREAVEIESLLLGYLPASNLVQGCLQSVRAPMSEAFPILGINVVAVFREVRI